MSCKWWSSSLSFQSVTHAVMVCSTCVSDTCTDCWWLVWLKVYLIRSSYTVEVFLPSSGPNITNINWCAACSPVVTAIVCRPCYYTIQLHAAPVAGTSVLAAGLSALAADSSALAAFSPLAAAWYQLVYRPLLLCYSTAASISGPSVLAAGPPALAALVAGSTALAAACLSCLFCICCSWLCILLVLYG